MFGYLQPYKPYLMIKDFEIYKSVYCGLCKKLGEEYGIFARLALSYDCTCYSILAMALAGECEGIYKKRCVFNPLKKCSYCKSGSTCRCDCRNKYRSSCPWSYVRTVPFSTISGIS